MAGGVRAAQQISILPTRAGNCKCSFPPRLFSQLIFQVQRGRSKHGSRLDFHVPPAE